MKPLHWYIIWILAPLLFISAWLPGAGGTSHMATPPTVDLPHAYIYDFNTLIMRQDGTPEHKLQAKYMSQPRHNIAELILPELQILKPGKPPLIITAERSRIIADEDFTLLQGETRLVQKDVAGRNAWEIITSNARLLTNGGYAETNQSATILAPKITARSTGINAYLNENKLELLNDVYTKIIP